MGQDRQTRLAPTLQTCNGIPIEKGAKIVTM